MTREQLFASFGASLSDKSKPLGDYLIEQKALKSDDPVFDHVGSGPADSAQSRQIRNYRLLQKLGEGGMGTVWMAEQEKPVRRRVALKLIKAGIDNEQIIARFEAERQALSMMDHVNIARVLDAGTTDSGQPYFVMELVQGISLTEYGDKHRLSLRDRLELFMS